MTRLLAHMDGDRGHALDDHLYTTGERAAEHARVFGGEVLARLAGRSHDLGKALDGFQRRLAGSAERFEHSLHGAKLWHERAPKHLVTRALALVIAGHHTGLPNSQDSDEHGHRPMTSLLTRLRKTADVDAALAGLPTGFLDAELPPLPAWLPAIAGSRRAREAALRSYEMWIRFLFSALVDADYLDTETFFQGDRRERTPDFPPVAELRRRLDAHVDGLAAEAEPSEVNRVRAAVLAACRDAAAREPGFFSLTVPTGGGKTLAAMSFALRHAEEHDLRRVIVAIPFTSILEQNANVYASALGRDNVVEHHSAFEGEQLKDADDEIRLRHQLATENWHAPVVVTTNVQLLESLFANRTSRCRKLHNVARSVVVLDEAQTVPTDLLTPVLDGLRELTDHYGCTVVFATATQPAFAHRPGFAEGLEGVREIAPEPRRLARRLARYRPEWRLGEVVEWPRLADELAEHERVLCIVHRRDDAQELARALMQRADDVVHLSAAMCGAHRTEVLEDVKRRLGDGRPCRLVSTQLVEAGVDVDFPVVFRALGGLESLVQAAGRCNREGGETMGRFVIFRAPTKPPRGGPERGLEVLEAMAATSAPDLHDPDTVYRYFSELYTVSTPDRLAIQPARASLAFATVAKKFRMIDDSWSRPVVVPWGEARALVEELTAPRAPRRELLRRLQRYTVNAPRYRVENWLTQGLATLVDEAVVTLADPAGELYTNLFGLSASFDPDVSPGALMV